ncbi:unnamed protein product [Triticum turgidum subsp. durum]|uniref:Glycosyltransferase n=1 Tax=Triticum turgidum subsp. durum TaxID=4567 RepID=A0A9R0XI29_TRITD|nr:unnamed protein product [Triticum turgidum subsp. durum]
MAAAAAAHLAAQPRVMVLPFPAQGHVIPLMELSRKLVEHGFEIDFVNTEFNHDRVLQALAEDGAIPGGIQHALRTGRPGAGRRPHRHRRTGQGTTGRYVRPPRGDDQVEEDQVDDSGRVHELGPGAGHHGGRPCRLVLHVLYSRVRAQVEAPKADRGWCC